MSTAPLPEIEIITYNEGNGDDEITIPLRDMIARLQRALEEVPDGLKDRAVFHIKSYSDGNVSIYVQVEYR